MFGEEINIPDVIKNYIADHDGVNLQVNYNSAGANYGYSHKVWKTVSISRLTRTCYRCGYDILWAPDDSKSKCVRHSYGEYRYDNIFEWSDTESEYDLKTAFDLWLKEQEHGKAVRKMTFGKFGR